MILFFHQPLSTLINPYQLHAQGNLLKKHPAAKSRRVRKSSFFMQYQSLNIASSTPALTFTSFTMIFTGTGSRPVTVNTRGNSTPLADW